MYITYLIVYVFSNDYHIDISKTRYRYPIVFIFLITSLTAVVISIKIMNQVSLIVPAASGMNKWNILSGNSLFE